MSIGAVSTTTQARQRELWELMERLIGFRRRAFIPRSGQIAAELGISDGALAGLMVAVDGGWRLTPHGSAAIDRTWNEIHAHLRSLPLPADAVRRVLGICVRTSKDVAANDAHIAAWQRAGYRGPTIDVLTRVWYGATTRDALVDALKTTQEPVDVDRRIDELVTRGDLARNGAEVTLTSQGRESRERIEVETNDAAFARWPKGDELEQMFVDVKALLAALPPEEQLPRGKTH